MRLQSSVVLFVTVILELSLAEPIGDGYTYGYDGADSPGKVFCREKYGQSNHVVQENSTKTKIKVDLLGETLKHHIVQLKKTSNRKVDLIFLVDSSGSVAYTDYENELKFVSKLLSDFTVDRHTTRVAVITFSSKGYIHRGVDHMTRPSDDLHKCTLLEEELPAVKHNYSGGSTYTLGALLEALVRSPLYLLHCFQEKMYTVIYGLYIFDSPTFEYPKLQNYHLGNPVYNRISLCTCLQALMTGLVRTTIVIQTYTIQDAL